MSFRNTTAVILHCQYCGKDQSGRNTGKKCISHTLICLQHDVSQWASAEWVVALVMLM